MSTLSQLCTDTHDPHELTKPIGRLPLHEMSHEEIESSPTLAATTTPTATREGRRRANHEIRHAFERANGPSQCRKHHTYRHAQEPERCTQTSASGDHCQAEHDRQPSHLHELVGSDEDGLVVLVELCHRANPGQRDHKGANQIPLLQRQLPQHPRTYQLWQDAKTVTRKTVSINRIEKERENTIGATTLLRTTSKANQLCQMKY
jgi:hypothetical protein